MADDEKKKKADQIAEGYSSSWNKLKSGFKRAAEVLGVKDEEDPIVAAKEKRKKDLEAKYGK